jgi:hypothetical protein
MNEKELKEKYLEMEEKFLDEKQIKQSEININSMLRQQIQELKLYNQTLVKINEKYAKKYAQLKVHFSNLLDKN